MNYFRSICFLIAITLFSSNNISAQEEFITLPSIPEIGSAAKYQVKKTLDIKGSLTRTPGLGERPTYTYLTLETLKVTDNDFTIIAHIDRINIPKTPVHKSPIEHRLTTIIEGMDIKFKIKKDTLIPTIENINEMSEHLQRNLMELKSVIFDYGKQIEQFEEVKTYYEDLTEFYKGLSEQTAMEIYSAEIGPILSLSGVEIPLEGRLEFETPIVDPFTNTILVYDGYFELSSLDEFFVDIKLHNNINDDSIKNALKAMKSGNENRFTKEEIDALEKFKMIEDMNTSYNLENFWPSTIKYIKTLKLSDGENITTQTFTKLN